MSPYVPWRDAWERAHYGPRGFYREYPNPEQHFRTAVMDSSSRTSLIFEEVRHQYQRIGKPKDFTVLDAGSGNARLHHELTSLITQHELPWHIQSHNFPDGDLREIQSFGGAGVVIAHELLDDIPCTIAELNEHLLPVRIDVDPLTGHEIVWGELSAQETAWLNRWWPATVSLARREIGITRDQLWAKLLGLFDTGCAIMIDYCTTFSERASGHFDAGTLIGYQNGRATRPIPDSSMNITAHVSIESLIELAAQLGKPAPEVRRESVHSDFHWLVQPL